jgi:hypothetical protein
MKWKTKAVETESGNRTRWYTLSFTELWLCFVVYLKLNEYHLVTAAGFILWRKSKKLSYSAPSVGPCCWLAGPEEWQRPRHSHL